MMQGVRLILFAEMRFRAATVRERCEWFRANRSLTVAALNENTGSAGMRVPPVCGARSIDLTGLAHTFNNAGILPGDLEARPQLILAGRQLDWHNQLRLAIRRKLDPT